MRPPQRRVEPSHFGVEVGARAVVEKYRRAHHAGWPVSVQMARLVGMAMERADVQSRKCGHSPVRGPLALPRASSTGAPHSTHDCIGHRFVGVGAGLRARSVGQGCARRTRSEREGGLEVSMGTARAHRPEAKAECAPPSAARPSLRHVDPYSRSWASLPSTPAVSISGGFLGSPGLERARAGSHVSAGDPAHRHTNGHRHTSQTHVR